IILRPANLQFRDGAPLTGQSDHLVNLQMGIGDKESTSQATLLFSYASQRVTARGASNFSGVGFLPDVVELPGYRIDFVARQGFKVLGREVELKFEARNLTGTRYQEFQDFPSSRVFVNRYRLGRTVSLGLSVTL
ncbi:MAG: TonB-dependent receptor, partial [Sphingomonas sp.]